MATNLEIIQDLQVFKYQVAIIDLAEMVKVLWELPEGGSEYEQESARDTIELAEVKKQLSVLLKDNAQDNEVRLDSYFISQSGVSKPIKLALHGHYSNEQFIAKQIGIDVSNYRLQEPALPQLKAWLTETLGAQPLLGAQNDMLKAWFDWIKKLAGATSPTLWEEGQNRFRDWWQHAKAAISPLWKPLVVGQVTAMLSRSVLLASQRREWLIQGTNALANGGKIVIQWGSARVGWLAGTSALVGTLAVEYLRARFARLALDQFKQQISDNQITPDALNAARVGIDAQQAMLPYFKSYTQINTYQNYAAFKAGMEAQRTHDSVTESVSTHRLS